MKARYVGLDCLRGLAALVVLVAHYSARFKQLYPDIPTFSWSIPFDYARYAVQLFFVISGFVIFMTLERIERPIDFIKARFFRLYPPFWAAATFTFLLLHLFSLPGREVSLSSYLASLTMIAKTISLRNITFYYVDGVYWTLEREFFFYVIMATVLAAGLKNRLYLIILGLLLWSRFLPRLDIIDNFWRWKIQNLTLTGYITYFALGISLYRIKQNKHRWPYFGVLIVCFWIVGRQGLPVFLVIGGLTYASLFVRKVPQLLSPLAFLGTISYSLYLVHQNLGYVVLREMGLRHINGSISFVVATSVAILVATGLCYGVEKPVMAWHKRRIKSRVLAASHAS